MTRKIISTLLCLSFLFQQTSFAQVAAVELNLAGHLARLSSGLPMDTFRPLHLRYFSYDTLNNTFKVLLDKGDSLKGLSPTTKGSPERSRGKGTDPEQNLKAETKELLKYFLIGVTLPNDKFWVNLRPDSPSQIIDSSLEETDIGKIMLEADLQLKKDTAQFTSPQTPEGKEYWDKLYKKAEEIYGYDTVTIPTLTRPWIVPGEIIVRETKDSAYIYKATLKVLLEEDYLRSQKTEDRSQNLSVYEFKDSRSKALNEYSTQLIKELIIPKLTREVNTSKKYASLRQVYYSLILSRWFKLRFANKKGVSRSTVIANPERGEAITNLKGTDPSFISLINSQNLTNLISKTNWSKTTYFNEYKKSFAQGEYNIKEPVYTPTGQVIRSYFSGGMRLGVMDFSGQRIAESALRNNAKVYQSMGLEEFRIADGYIEQLSGSPIGLDEEAAKIAKDVLFTPYEYLRRKTPFGQIIFPSKKAARRTLQIILSHPKFQRKAKLFPDVKNCLTLVPEGNGFRFVLSDAASKLLNPKGSADLIPDKERRASKGAGGDSSMVANLPVLLLEKIYKTEHDLVSLSIGGYINEADKVAAINDRKNHIARLLGLSENDQRTTELIDKYFIIDVTGNRAMGFEYTPRINWDRIRETEDSLIGSIGKPDSTIEELEPGIAEAWQYARNLYYDKFKDKELKSKFEAEQILETYAIEHGLKKDDIVKFYQPLYGRYGYTLAVKLYDVIFDNTSAASPAGQKPKAGSSAVEFMPGEKIILKNATGYIIDVIKVSDESIDAMMIAPKDDLGPALNEYCCLPRGDLASLVESGDREQFRKISKDNTLNIFSKPVGSSAVGQLAVWKRYSIIYKIARRIRWDWPIPVDQIKNIMQDYVKGFSNADIGLIHKKLREMFSESSGITEDGISKFIKESEDHLITLINSGEIQNTNAIKAWLAAKTLLETDYKVLGDLQPAKFQDINSSDDDFSKHFTNLQDKGLIPTDLKEEEVRKYITRHYRFRLTKRLWDVIEAASSALTPDEQVGRERDKALKESVKNDGLNFQFMLDLIKSAGVEEIGSKWVPHHFKTINTSDFGGIFSEPVALKVSVTFNSPGKLYMFDIGQPYPSNNRVQTFIKVTYDDKISADYIGIGPDIKLTPSELSKEIMRLLRSGLTIVPAVGIEFTLKRNSSYKMMITGELGSSWIVKVTKSGEKLPANTYHIPKPNLEELSEDDDMSEHELLQKLATWQVRISGTAGSALELLPVIRKWQDALFGDVTSKNIRERVNKLQYNFTKGTEQLSLEEAQIAIMEAVNLMRLDVEHKQPIDPVILASFFWDASLHFAEAGAGENSRDMDFLANNVEALMRIYRRWYRIASEIDEEISGMMVRIQGNLDAWQEWFKGFFSQRSNLAAADSQGVEKIMGEFEYLKDEFKVAAGLKKMNSKRKIEFLTNYLQREIIWQLSKDKRTGGDDRFLEAFKLFSTAIRGSTKSSRLLMAAKEYFAELEILKQEIEKIPETAAGSAVGLDEGRVTKGVGQSTAGSAVEQFSPLGLLRLRKKIEAIRLILPGIQPMQPGRVIKEEEAVEWGKKILKELGFNTKEVDFLLSNLIFQIDKVRSLKTIDDLTKTTYRLEYGQTKVKILEDMILKNYNDPFLSAESDLEVEAWKEAKGMKDRLDRAILFKEKEKEDGLREEAGKIKDYGLRKRVLELLKVQDNRFILTKEFFDIIKEREAEVISWPRDEGYEIRVSYDGGTIMMTKPLGEESIEEAFKFTKDGIHVFYFVKAQLASLAKQKDTYFFRKAFEDFLTYCRREKILKEAQELADKISSGAAGSPAGQGSASSAAGVDAEKLYQLMIAGHVEDKAAEFVKGWIEDDCKTLGYPSTDTIALIKGFVIAVEKLLTDNEAKSQKDKSAQALYVRDNYKAFLQLLDKAINEDLRKQNRLLGDLELVKLRESDFETTIYVLFGLLAYDPGDKYWERIEKIASILKEILKENSFGSTVADENKAVVVIAGEGGRWGDGIGGYPLGTSIKLGDSVMHGSFSMLLEGDNANQIKKSFLRYTPNFRERISSNIHIVRDGNVWLLITSNPWDISKWYNWHPPEGQEEREALGKELKKKAEEINPVVTLITKSGQVVRFLPEAIPDIREYDDETFERIPLKLDFSKTWTPNLKSLLKAIKAQKAEISDKIANGSIALVHNGKYIPDSTIYLKLNEGDEIAFVPPIIEAVKPDPNRIVPRIYIVSEAGPELAKLLDDPDAYPGRLAEEQKEIVDSIHAKGDVREILSRYLIKEYDRKKAVIKMVELGYHEGLANGWLDKVDAAGSPAGQKGTEIATSPLQVRGEIAFKGKDNILDGHKITWVGFKAITFEAPDDNQGKAFSRKFEFTPGEDFEKKLVILNEGLSRLQEFEEATYNNPDMVNAFRKQYRELVENLTGSLSQAGSAVEGVEKTGGIDFKNQAMASATTYETFGSFAGLDFNLPVLSASAIAGFNLDKEEIEITRLVDNQILPSGQRIKEFMAASAAKGEFGKRRETVIAWLAKMGMLEETHCCTQEASKEYKEAIVIAESYAAIGYYPSRNRL